MKSKKLFVVPSAYDKSLKLDEPLLFLGTWCFPTEKKELLLNLDYKILKPIIFENHIKDKQHKNIRIFQEKLLNILVVILNNQHNVKFSKKSWNILIGHWLRRATETMLNRIYIVKSSIEKFQLNGIYSFDKYDLSVEDPRSFIYAAGDNKWNSALISRIYRFYIKDSDFFQSNDSVSNSFYLEEKDLSKLKATASKILKVFSKKKDAFMISTYLNFFDNFFLNLSLGQIPQIPITPKLYNRNKTDILLRKKLKEILLKNKDSSQFNKDQKILCSLIFEIMPRNYLEDFNLMEKTVDNIGWPSKPNFIFTSNEFDTNDIFKLWTIKKMQKGTKYYVGQHGNNYGTNKYVKDTVEELTADKFITWGWTANGKQYKKGFIFRNKKIKNKVNNGHLLMIENTTNHKISIWDQDIDFLNHLKNQSKLIKNLNFAPKKNLLIRLHNEHNKMHLNEKSIILKNNPDVNIDDGLTDIYSLFSNSKLILHNYDSTGLLQTLANNKPSLAFFSNGFDHIREEAIPYYELLINSGIIHFDYLSLANKINSVWDDVDSWWSDKSVQENIRQFCHNYARVVDSNKNEIKRILTS